MTYAQIARKDFEDAIRSRMVWGLIAAFVGFMAFVLIVALGTTDTAEATGGAALRLTAQFGQLFVPLIALITGYLAIVGERRVGSLRVLFSYPHTRADVVLGKLLGRSAVISVALGIGSVVSILLIAILVESPDFENVIGILAVMVLYGAAFTGLAVGISASVRTRGKAMALAIGSLLVFLLVWDAAAAGVYALVTGSLPGLEAEAWYFAMKQANPLGAFRRLAGSYVDGRIPAIVHMGVEDIPQDVSQEQLQVANRVSGSLPVYLSTWFAGLILAAWGLVPAMLGYLRFRNADI